MGFVPVHFGLAGTATCKSDRSRALEFSPPTRSITPPESLYITYRSTNCNDLYVLDLADELKVHLDCQRFALQAAWISFPLSLTVRSKDTVSAERSSNSALV